MSRNASFLATLCLALLSPQNTIAQKVFVPKGEGVCVDSAGAQYDSLETLGITSIEGCQSRCTILDGTNLRGIEYEATSQKCNCLYENGAGFPANALIEVGEDVGAGGVAGTNATFSTFQCYTFTGGSFSLVGTGGCVDSNSEFYSFATPLNARGTQTAVDCQGGCVAAGTNGLVGLDYNGECYCLYSVEGARTVASSAIVPTNSGTGTVAGTSTFAGIVCQGFAAPPTPAPTPPPTLSPVVIDRGGGTGTGVATVPTVGKAPRIKSVKAPTLDTTSRGTKLSTGKAPAPVQKSAKRRLRR